jgi:hypothetical protein
MKVASCYENLQSMISTVESTASSWGTLNSVQPTARVSSYRAHRQASDAVANVVCIVTAWSGFHQYNPRRLER